MRRGRLTTRLMGALLLSRGVFGDGLDGVQRLVDPRRVDPGAWGGRVRIHFARLKRLPALLRSDFAAILGRPDRCRGAPGIDFP